MGTIKVHAGDFKGSGNLTYKGLSLTPKERFMAENFSLGDLESVDIATEESVKKLGGAIGWGAAGALVLGPVGFLAGALLGGRGKEVTFVAKFKNGKKFLGTTDSSTFTKIQAAVFK